MPDFSSWVGIINCFKVESPERIYDVTATGKAIFKIPYLALPTVWLHNINAKTQVEVETGV